MNFYFIWVRSHFNLLFQYNDGGGMLLKPTLVKLVEALSCHYTQTRSAYHLSVCSIFLYFLEALIEHLINDFILYKSTELLRIDAAHWLSLFCWLALHNGIYVVPYYYKLQLLKHAVPSKKDPWERLSITSKFHMLMFRVHFLSVLVIRILILSTIAH